MNIQWMGVPLEIKELTETGTFEGLASVYGNIDLGGDIVEAGAFKEFVTTPDGAIRILDGHSTRSPIGKGRVTDTHIGLAIKAQLNLKVARARDVHELMKDGIIGGLSIGYDVREGGSNIDEAGIRHLTDLKLWEVSTVVFPMNEAARVAAVKNTIERCRNVREVEDMLRDAVGLSRSKAAHHAGEIWRTLTGQRDADGEVSEEVRDMVSRLGQLR